MDHSERSHPLVNRPCLESVLSSQREWAMRKGLPVDAQGYLPDVEANLRAPLSDVARAAFTKGSGGELSDRKGKRAKMRSLISSSALTVNVFDFWSDGDRDPLGAALMLRDRIIGLTFEMKRPTGARGIPPNLDVDIQVEGGRVVGLECKFTEWMREKDCVKAMHASYFDGAESRWSRGGLPKTHELACAIRDGNALFRLLDAPQLLKHALGLAREAYGSRASFELFYVYYDWGCVSQDAHRREIDAFARAVGDELRFRAMSYQEIVRQLAAALTSSGEQSYLAYLVERYFSEPRAAF
jgi:hypothetical protein